jgi:hypothetical protein
MVDSYIKDELPGKPKNASNTRQHLQWWESKLGAYALSDLTPTLVVQYRDELKVTVTRRGTLIANATVVRYMASLSHACNIAVKDWQWMEVADPSDIPFYNSDIEEKPTTVLRGFAQMAAADALVLSCTEYNYSIAPALKNILDWASRVPRNALLSDKLVALMDFLNVLPVVRVSVRHGHA